ncbi:MAG: hypothetical protein ACI97B_003696 [Verrucomicrobiales bacterium]|jgi:hypothetical protein
MSEDENLGIQEGDAIVTPAETEGDTNTDEVRTDDADTDPAERGRGTWTTSLPKGIREAMKSNRRVTLPRAYEDRLRRYFESLE